MNMDEKDIKIEEAFRQNYDNMVIYCARFIGTNDAEDVVNETFLLLQEKWEGFDHHSPQIISWWLFRALKNKCLEYANKKRRRKEISDTDFLNHLDADDFLDSDEENIKYIEYLRQIQQRLSDKERSVFDCLIEHRLSIRETAELLHITPNNVYVRWSRTKQHIRAFIDEIIKQ